MPITGQTRIMPIIGYPVGSVFSPPAFNRFFDGHGIDAVMVGLDIMPPSLAPFWQVLRGTGNMVGCSVTYPHKQAAFVAVDGMTDRAARLGALNTIRREVDGRLTGEATDGQAMMVAIVASGYEVRGRSAHVVGAGGGAGMAIVDALCEAGVARLVLEEVDPQRREALLQSLGQNWPHVAVTGDGQPAEILVNATTLGKAATDPVPFSRAAIEAARLCCDVVTGSGDTPFVVACRQKGIAVVDGNAMGAGQIEAQLRFVGLL